MTTDINITYSEVQRMVQDIIRQISLHNWRPDYVVGIIPGGLMPVLMLGNYFNISINTLNVQFRDGKEYDCESNCWMAEDAIGYKMDSPSNILVVNSINNTGNTFNWIKSDWESSVGLNRFNWKNIWHNNVRFATLVDNSACSTEVDYFSREVNLTETPCNVIFPWEMWWLISGRDKY